MPKIILWIDDMTVWAKSAQMKLEKMAKLNNTELHIIPRINGEDVLQELMQYNFDMILMDYHMEPHNGDKYIKDIRNEEHLEYVPIIFYSQDPTADLKTMVKSISNIETIYRPELLDFVAKKLW